MKLRHTRSGDPEWLKLYAAMQEGRWTKGRNAVLRHNVLTWPEYETFADMGIATSKETGIIVARGSEHRRACDLHMMGLYEKGPEQAVSPQSNALADTWRLKRSVYEQLKWMRNNKPKACMKFWTPPHD